MSEKSVTCNCTNLLHRIEEDKEDILQEHTLRHQNQICGGKPPSPPPVEEWILYESLASTNIQARKWNGWNVVITIIIYDIYIFFKHSKTGSEDQVCHDGNLNSSLFLWEFANNQNTFFCLKKRFDHWKCTFRMQKLLPWNAESVWRKGR